MSVNIIDNFLPDEYFSEITKTIFGAHMPWFPSYNGSEYENDGNIQFVHSLYDDHLHTSDKFFLFEHFVNMLGPSVLIRMKLNLLPKTENKKQYNFHHDLASIDVGYKTGILYLNSNNGHTLFDDGTKVDSVANRFVSFDGHKHSHCAVSQTDELYRVVLNVNWIPWMNKDNLNNENNVIDINTWGTE
jgi:hypothetical protein